MKPGYSKALLHEGVVTSRNPHNQMTGLDLTMMMAFSSSERTEDIWRNLLASAGLKITKIWGSPNAVESVIEAELA